MQIRLKPLVAVLLLFAAALGVSVAGEPPAPTASAPASAQRNDDLARQIIARERASVDAWMRKDKAFFMEFFTDDATYFSGMNPYLEVDPKQTFLPNFDKYTEMFKYNDVQMYNPRVQVYGDVAVLTYNSSVSGTMTGQPINYTAKMTVVYVKQGNTWRVAHGHESINPAAR